MTEYRFSERTGPSAEFNRRTIVLYTLSVCSGPYDESVGLEEISIGLQKCCTPQGSHALQIGFVVKTSNPSELCRHESFFEYDHLLDETHFMLDTQGIPFCTKRNSVGFLHNDVLGANRIAFLDGTPGENLRHRNLKYIPDLSS